MRRRGCAGAELATMREQFPVEPLQFLPQTPRIAFAEGMRLLQEAGFEVLLWEPHSSMQPPGAPPCACATDLP